VSDRRSLYATAEGRSGFDLGRDTCYVSPTFFRTSVYVVSVIYIDVIDDCADASGHR
jgi:hypothetical protein